MVKSEKRLTAWMSLLSILILTSGCATKLTSVCTYDPIHPSKQDRMTLGTKKQIETLNKNWELNNEK